MRKIPKDISEIDQRIQHMRQYDEVSHNKSRTHLWLDAAVRAITDFIAPIVVGSCLGYILDVALKTKPIMTIVLMLFGCAAGVLNLYRMGKRIERKTKD